MISLSISLPNYLFLYTCSSICRYINAKIDGRKSSFYVRDSIIDIQVENFINPVTGEEQDTKIQLPKGFIWKVADAAKTMIMRILTSNMNFDDSDKMLSIL